MNQEDKVGLILSGGTLKGAAHAGAIEALAELNIPIHCIAGTSAGSIVGTLYAHGYRSSEFKSLLKTFPGVKLLDYGFPISSHLWYHTLKRCHRHRKASTLSVGLLKGRKLKRYVSRLLKGRNAQIPYYIVATDLNSGDPVVFSNAAETRHSDGLMPITNLPTSILASCAMPGIFSPVFTNGQLLVDGAIRHYAPVHVLRQAGCSKLILINLLTLDTDWKPYTVLDIVARSFEVMLRETIEDDIHGRDLTVIEPALSHVKWTSFDELDACYAEGYNAVMRNRTKLIKMLNDPEPVGSGPVISFQSANRN
ncbi:patatin-like phospholipase family protein [Alicyclobacillus sp. SO9]|uniref:patatin-like phospholipase family protein n=1 Tax=Alicyclobacillus sp. SO9 TaxID=2665646 RepID=UPI0018E80A61|nr:patatin-like phospholipase family protein [Alicyclobacillus sp. SO9]